MSRLLGAHTTLHVCFGAEGLCQRPGHCRDEAPGSPPDLPPPDQRQGCAQSGFIAGVPAAGRPVKGGPWGVGWHCSGASFIGQIKGREVTGRNQMGHGSCPEHRGHETAAGVGMVADFKHTVWHGVRELSGGDREKRGSLSSFAGAWHQASGRSSGRACCRPERGSETLTEALVAAAEPSLGTQCRRAGLGSRPWTGKLALPFTPLAVALEGGHVWEPDCPGSCSAALSCPPSCPPSAGRNEKGQLGHGDTKRVEAPRLIEGLSHEAIVSAACGRNHTLALTGKRLVPWYCGKRPSGPLWALG